MLVLAVGLMVNYLGAKFSHRFFLSPQTSVQLSSRTLTILRSLTNAVNVTLYFDRKDEFFPDIVALLNEYRAANPKISIRTVDYVRDAGEAEKTKQQYHQYFSALSDKNLVIFDCANHVKMVPGDALTQYTLEQVPNPKEREFRRKPVAFAGEKIFTAMLLALESPQPLKAYFLQGHGEPSLTGSGNFDYLKFAGTLQQNYVTVSELQLLGDTGVPLDCNLLIIAAPTTTLTEMELQKIGKYLQEGGRLFACSITPRSNNQPDWRRFSNAGRSRCWPMSCKTRRTPSPVRTWSCANSTSIRWSIRSRNFRCNWSCRVPC